MTQPAREPEAAKPAEAAAEIPADEPPPGQSYLQVMAVRRPEAEVVLKALKEKGFPATLGPGPNELLRVLVGPYTDNAALGDAKARLESAGFHPIVRR
jgi:cell division septation protein DedD